VRRWVNSVFLCGQAVAVISAKGDPLEMSDRVPFESFRAAIEAAALTPAIERRATLAASRLMSLLWFRGWCAIALRLSDVQIEYRFAVTAVVHAVLRLGIEDSIPAGHDAVVVPETLAKAFSLRNCSMLFASIWKRGLHRSRRQMVACYRLFRFPAA